MIVPGDRPHRFVIHDRDTIYSDVAHYNHGRPHASLGPGIPGRAREHPIGESRGHRLPNGYRVIATAILGGLHHEYCLERNAA